jgi:hypothetical protein
VYVDVSTSASLNGTYFVSNVYGKNSNGTTAFFHVLDTSASNSSGPIEGGLHYYLFNRALKLYAPEGNDDPYGRKKHCYVICGPGDSIRDIASNSYGMSSSWMIWRSCKSICDDCPF